MKVEITVISDNGDVCTTELNGNESDALIDALQSGEEPEALSGSLARDALKICYAEAKSIQTGRSIPVK